MKYLFLLLILTVACAKDQIDNMPVDRPLGRSLPPLDELQKDDTFSQKRYKDFQRVFLIAEKEFSIFFDDEQLSPFISVRNGVWPGIETNNPSIPDFPLNFQNNGKTLVYTNKNGGIKINSEEILMSPAELSNFIIGNPLLSDDYYKTRYMMTLFTYSRIYSDFLKEIKTPTDALSLIDDMFSRKDLMVEGLIAQQVWMDYSSWNFPEANLLSMQESLISDPVKRENFQNLYTNQNNPLLEQSYFAHNIYLVSLLPIDDLKKLYVTLLNIILLDIQQYGYGFYWGERRADPSYFRPMRVKISQMSLDPETGQRI